MISHLHVFHIINKHLIDFKQAVPILEPTPLRHSQWIQLSNYVTLLPSFHTQTEAKGFSFFLLQHTHMWRGQWHSLCQQKLELNDKLYTLRYTIN